jgi:hypothetical protein
MEVSHQTGYFTGDWSNEKNVRVVDCENGLKEICDLSNLTPYWLSGWNFPIVAQELVIGGDCPSGVSPEIPEGVKVGMYAPDGITFLDGFHVTADNVSYFIASPTCPVNNEDDDKSTNNSIVNNRIIKSTNSNSLNINHSNADKNINLNIYPNPTFDNLNIYLSEGIQFPVKIEIKDALGKVVYSMNEKIDKHTIINLASYPKGIYFLKVKTTEKTYIEKVIKQ